MTAENCSCLYFWRVLKYLYEIYTAYLIDQKRKPVIIDKLITSWLGGFNPKTSGDREWSLQWGVWGTKPPTNRGVKCGGAPIMKKIFNLSEIVFFQYFFLDNNFFPYSLRIIWKIYKKNSSKSEQKCFFLRF